MKNISFISLLLIALLPIMLTSCVEKTVKWPENGTTLQANKYRLEVVDSSKILIQDGETFTLLSPPDSLLVNKFTTEYSAVDNETNKYFKKRASQVLTNTSSPDIAEYYSFSKGNVLFLGYSNINEQEPFTCFEPPLIILSSKFDKDIESSGMMKTFVKANETFREGENTVFSIKRRNKLDLKYSKTNVKTCYLQEITIKQNATIAVGEKELIVPEALKISTKLLVDQEGIPIAEWSLKSETMDDSGENRKKRKLFIELIIYKNSI